MNSPGRLSLERIERAAAVIDPVFTRTPQFISEPLGARLGCRVLCKVETVNPIRSFKGRGASWFCAQRPRGEHLVAASAGNFGQGLAYAARRHGLAVTVFAAENASPLKVERMRRLGATVHLAGADLDEAKDRAREWAAARGLPFVEDGREVAISEGAGTIAAELTAWPEPIERLLVPVGNGALAAGMGTWMRAHSPGTRIVAVCAAGAPAMARSWEHGRVETTPAAHTIADGIAVRVPVPEAVHDVQSLIDEYVLVSDDQIRQAMRWLYEDTGLLVEPAGAAALAAVPQLGGLDAGTLLAVPLCGSNMTDAQLRSWLWPGSA
jgi:threonine dehydratase